MPSTEEPEAPVDVGSQWPPGSMWYHLATILSVWAPAEDWEEVDGSLDSTEKALQAVSSHLLNKVAWTASGTVGWIFLTALNASMEGALHDAAPVHHVSDTWKN